jgi:hypothetical protein
VAEDGDGSLSLWVRKTHDSWCTWSGFDAQEESRKALVLFIGGLWWFAQDRGDKLTV